MMGFFMSFLLLLIALYGFQIVTQDASDLETKAVYTDIAGRVANGVLNAVDIGTKRVGSTTTAQSSQILFQQILILPSEVHAQQYRVALTSGAVTVTSLDGRISESATTFNLQTSTCSASVAVCGLSGTYLSKSDGLRIKYEYKPTESSMKCTSTNQPTNCITIS